MKIGFGFSCENPYGSLFFYEKIFTSNFLTRFSHGENFKTNFQPNFHSK
jgi:hypothetical protein